MTSLWDYNLEWDEFATALEELQYIAQIGNAKHFKDELLKTISKFVEASFWHELSWQDERIWLLSFENIILNCPNPDDWNMLEIYNKELPELDWKPLKCARGRIFVVQLQKEYQNIKKIKQAYLEIDGGKLTQESIDKLNQIESGFREFEENRRFLFPGKAPGYYLDRGWVYETLIGEELEKIKKVKEESKKEDEFILRKLWG